MHLLLLPLPAARGRLCIVGIEVPTLSSVPQIIISARVCGQLRAKWLAMMEVMVTLPTAAGIYGICLLLFVAMVMVMIMMTGALKARHAETVDARNDAAQNAHRQGVLRWRWETDGSGIGPTGRKSAVDRRRHAAFENGDV